MTTVSDIFQFLNHFAPVSLAEEWDNVGLLCGDSDAGVNRALIALDITSKVAQEAARKSVQLIVSHHPVIFHPLRSVMADSAVWQMAKASVSAICMHTNLDLCNGGVNDALAETLEISGREILLPEGKFSFQKISVFVPAGYAEAVRLAMAEAGAGTYKGYDSCAYETSGSGYFRPLAGSNPFIGEVGKPEKTEEVKIEAVCAEDKVKAVVSAMLKAHPYEVPAYDIFADEGPGEPYGLGRVGDLPSERALPEFAEFVKQKLSCGMVKICNGGKTVRRVAVCGGSGDESLIFESLRKGADTLVVGEMKHSSKIVAVERDLNIVEAGHFATENVICPHLCKLLSQQFPAVSFELAESNRDPSSKI